MAHFNTTSDPGYKSDEFTPDPKSPCVRKSNTLKLTSNANANRTNEHRRIKRIEAKAAKKAKTEAKTEKGGDRVDALFVPIPSLERINALLPNVQNVQRAPETADEEFVLKCLDLEEWQSIVLEYRDKLRPKGALADDWFEVICEMRDVFWAKFYGYPEIWYRDGYIPQCNSHEEDLKTAAKDGHPKWWYEGIDYTIRTAYPSKWNPDSTSFPIQCLKLEQTANMTPLEKGTKFSKQNWAFLKRRRGARNQILKVKNHIEKLNDRLETLNLLEEDAVYDNGKEEYAAMTETMVDWFLTK